MQFWRLEAPEYDSDYRQTYINGSLEHPFGLPGVRCDVCQQTWGGSRILPFECPASLRGHRNLTDGGRFHSTNIELLSGSFRPSCAAPGVLFRRSDPAMISSRAISISRRVRGLTSSGHPSAAS